MQVNEIIEMFEKEINKARADAVVETAKVESYYKGMIDGLVNIRKNFIYSINDEFEKKNNTEQTDQEDKKRTSKVAKDTTK